VAGLDEQAAQQFAGYLNETQRSVSLLPCEATEIWQRALLEVADRRDAPPLLAGRATRLLLDVGKLPAAEVAARLSRALSLGATPTDQAGWVEGLLFGDALLLIHDAALLRILDGWLTDLENESFTDVVPLIRRTFGVYDLTERRHIEQRVLGALDKQPALESELDFTVAADVLKTVRLLLGEVSE
jgi:hypothetical protein